MRGMHNLLKNIGKIFLIILSLFLFIHCEKKKDYREKYLGNFEFTVEISLINTMDTLHTDSTVVYNGEIVSGSGSDNITINFLPDLRINAILSESGGISKDPNSGLGWGVGGDFKSTDEVSFNVFLPVTYYRVHGTRIQ